MLQILANRLPVYLNNKLWIKIPQTSLSQKWFLKLSFDFLLSFCDFIVADPSEKVK
jgi:hypothetical protein